MEIKKIRRPGLIIVALALVPYWGFGQATKEKGKNLLSCDLSSVRFLDYEENGSGQFISYSRIFDLKVSNKPRQFKTEIGYARSFGYWRLGQDFTDIFFSTTSDDLYLNAYYGVINRKKISVNAGLGVLHKKDRTLRLSGTEPVRLIKDPEEIIYSRGDAQYKLHQGLDLQVAMGATYWLTNNLGVDFECIFQAGYYVSHVKLGLSARF
jgi:hypothetical protein